MDAPAPAGPPGAPGVAPEETIDLLPAAAETGRSLVYLITFSALLPDTQAAHGGGDLRDVSTATREDIRDAVLDAVADPYFGPQTRGGRPRQRQPAVQKLVVAQEKHAARAAWHFHVALKLTEKTRFLPYAQALRRRHHLASHWSDTHTQWWSAVRYLSIASETKLTVDAGAITWTPDGASINLFADSQEPWNAHAMRARRERAAMLPPPPPPPGPKRAKTEKFTKLDFTALVIAEGLHTKNAVMAYVQEKGSAGMQSFVNRNQRRLDDLVSEAFEWAAAPSATKAEQETDWAMVARLAQGSCACGGGGCVWWAAAQAFFERNDQIDRLLLAAALRKVICEGPSKTGRVPMIVGPTNAGKSTILDPLYNVFGRKAVFNKPKLGASCPLANLNKKKRFIFFDDYPPVEYAALPRENPTVAVTTFLAMFQRQPFDVQVSQSFNDGHPELVWKRGAAMTAKEYGLWEPIGLVSREDIRHMQSRVMQFRATVSMPHEDLAEVPNCAHSFARWLVVDSAAYAANHALRVSPGIRGAVLPLLPDEANAAVDA